MRLELLKLLPHANIEEGHLITLDDLPPLAHIGSILSPERTKWILVDHNALQGVLGSMYSGRVQGVIDHHEDESKVPQNTGDEPRIITTSGSCSSLVIEYFRNGWDDLSLRSASSGASQAQGDSLVDDGAVASLWDAQVAQFALASVLIDTTNLTDVNKTTEHDVKVVEYLTTKIELCSKTAKDFNRNAFFNGINDAKSDLEPLSLYDILRKDYKAWEEQGMTLGTCVAVRPLALLQEKAKEGSSGSSFEPLLQELHRFAEQRSLAIASIMTTFSNEQGQYTRELLLTGITPEGQSAVSKFIDLAKSKLELTDVDAGEVHGKPYHVWKQMNLAASRKQVAPLLRAAISK